MLHHLDRAVAGAGGGGGITTFASFDATRKDAAAALLDWQGQTNRMRTGTTSNYFQALMKDIPTTGVYAFEVYGNGYRPAVALTTLDHTTFVNGGTPVSFWEWDGDHRFNGTLYSAYWDAFVVAAWLPMVLDFDTRIMYCPKSGALKASAGAVTTANPLNFLGQVYANVANATNVYVNSGHFPFQNASFESMVTALEGTLGKSITRGFGI